MRNFLSLAVSPALVCLWLSCGIPMPEGTVKSRSFVYDFARYDGDSVPAYAIRVSKPGGRQSVKKDDLDCGTPDEAVEIHFAADQIVLVVWWQVTHGIPGRACLVAFQSTPEGLQKLLEPSELRLLDQALTALRIPLQSGQRKPYERDDIRDFVVDHKLIEKGNIFAYLELK